MSDERLELVTDFATLKAGMLVVLKSCACGSAHRHLLLELAHGEYIAPQGPVTGPCWDVLPRRACHPSLKPVIAPHNVAQRRLFRVVDGLDPAADEGAAVADEMCARVRANRVWAR